MRVLKIILAMIAMTYGVALVIFVALLLISGPSVALKVWTSPYLIAVYPFSLFVAVRYLR